MKNVLLTILALSALSVHAQQTQIRLNVQGILRTASGIAVPDGPQNVTFKLYTVASGGTAEWEETAQVTVTAGIYSYNLGGGQTAIDPSIFANRLFLGVTVDGTELLPRAELTYSPYSIRAFTAFTVACSGAVGDVKYSILNPDEFRLENGDCWVPMDGRSIAGSKLAARTGRSSIPDGSGLFIRSQEFNGGANNDPDRTSATAIATIQQHELFRHNHTTSPAGEHSHSHRDKRTGEDWAAPLGGDAIDSDMYANGDGTGGFDEIRRTGTEPNHVHQISETGGNETRPKNINLWTYIRIN